MPSLRSCFLDNRTTATTHLTGVLGGDKQDARTGACCLALSDLLELSPTSIENTLVQTSFR